MFTKEAAENQQFLSPTLVQKINPESSQFCQRAYVKYLNLVLFLLYKVWRFFLLKWVELEGKKGFSSLDSLDKQPGTSICVISCRRYT